MDVPSFQSFYDPFTLALGSSRRMDGSTPFRFESWVRTDLEREDETH